MTGTDFLIVEEISVIACLSKKSGERVVKTIFGIRVDCTFKKDTV